MSVHQCPRCELRFSHEAELKGHLIDDHDVEPETLDTDLRYPPPVERPADSAEEAPEDAVTDTDR